MGEPEAPSAGRDVPPLSERVCEAVCLGFALWTLCAHAMVAVGGSLPWLVALYAAAAAAVLFASARLRAPRGAPSRPDAAAMAAPIAAEARRPAALAIALVAAGVALWRDDPILTWILLVLVLGGAAFAFLRPAPPPIPPPRRSRSAEHGLVAIAVACALYALFVHRPDADDAFYLNVAVAAVDRPDLPLLARDTLHGRVDLPIHYPAYRLHSYELWNGAVALLTGIPVAYVFHWIAAAIAAALVPLCHAVLFRRLTPHCWPWTTLALVVVLAAAGETHRWYGNFAFVRMWQGKAIALFVFLPLVYAFAIRFAQRGDATAWLRLAAAQVAALGCSANTIWAAPVAALTAMGCVLLPTSAGVRRLLAGALASGYVVAGGLLVRPGMTGIPALTETFAPGEQLGEALHTVFGDGRLYVVGIASLFLAGLACPPGLGRRFAIGVPLAVSLVLLNPWGDAWVRNNVTGPSYWRAMWAIPAPMLMAMLLVAPLGSAAVAARAGPRALVLALLAAFALFVPRQPGFSEGNEGAWLGVPSLKVGSAHFWATALNELAPGGRVVAPRAVNSWIPISHGHAHPMVVRNYLRPLRARIGEMQYRDRVVMTQFAEGILEHPRAAAIFERGLELYDVQAACILKTDHTEDAREILRRSGFTKRVQGPNMEIWARRPQAAAGRAQ